MVWDGPSTVSEGRPPREYEPAQNRDGREQGWTEVSQQQRGRNGAREARQVRDDVIDGRDEPSVDDMRDSDHNAAGERDRQQEAHHKIRV
jgi:hypothetical protein